MSVLEKLDRLKNLGLKKDDSGEAKLGVERGDGCGFTPEELAAAPEVEEGDDPDGDR